MLFVFEVLVGQSFGSLCTLQGAQLGVFKATESHRGLVFHSLPQFSFSHNRRTQHHLHRLTNQLRDSGRQEILLIRSSHFTLSYVHSATWQTTRYVLSAHQLNNKLIFSHKKKTKFVLIVALSSMISHMWFLLSTLVLFLFTIYT